MPRMVGRQHVLFPAKTSAAAKGQQRFPAGCASHIPGTRHRGAKSRRPAYSPQMTQARADQLDPAVLAALGHLELVARWVVDGFITGLHRSPRKGFSVEFAEHRQIGRAHV